MVDIPVRNIDEETLRLLVGRAKARGISVNEMAIEIIKAALDADDAAKAIRERSDSK
jgi:plasmid stability protein